uniref:PIPK domain-containing protein n=1 Tax=Macrostomum lignano TaxID=282301 RepID=A0A1I8HN29_9PLAT
THGLAQLDGPAGVAADVSTPLGIGKKRLYDCRLDQNISFINHQEPVELMELEEVTWGENHSWQQQEQQEMLWAPWIPDEMPPTPPMLQPPPPPPAPQTMLRLKSMSELLCEEPNDSNAAAAAAPEAGDLPLTWQQLRQHCEDDPPNLDAFDCLPELSASDVRRFFQLQSSGDSQRPLVVMVMNPPSRGEGGEGGCSYWTPVAGKLKPSINSSSSADGRDFHCVGNYCPPTEVADAGSPKNSRSDSLTDSDCGKVETSLATSWPHCLDDCERAAQWILGVHDAVGRDFASEMPRFKKKPMVHEFFGYILFLGCDGRVPALEGCAHFCRKSGTRVGHMVAKSHFKILNFSVVAQVWRRIKSNSSNDCIKNLKRAMRMSISNERNYFVDLKQAYHRLHIYKFGERSMSFFHRVFPDWFLSAEQRVPFISVWGIGGDRRDLQQKHLIGVSETAAFPKLK